MFDHNILNIWNTWLDLLVIDIKKYSNNRICKINLECYLATLVQKHVAPGDKGEDKISNSRYCRHGILSSV
jgi:hypothetical protein